MGKDEMLYVSKFFAMTLIAKEVPAKIKIDVAQFKSEFLEVGYCFEPGPAYPGL